MNSEPRKINILPYSNNTWMQFISTNVIFLMTKTKIICRNSERGKDYLYLFLLFSSLLCSVGSKPEIKGVSKRFSTLTSLNVLVELKMFEHMFVRSFFLFLGCTKKCRDGKNNLHSFVRRLLGTCQMKV